PGNRLYLRINYRTTEQVSQQALQVLQGSHFNNFEQDAEEEKRTISLMQGEEAVYQCFHDKDKEVQWVVDLLRPHVLSARKDASALEQICICARKKSSLQPFEKVLQKLNFPHCYIKGYAMEGHQQGIRLSTMHSIKGLEFSTIILVDISEETTPFRVPGFENLPAERQQTMLQLEKSLLYVAMSRAVERLYISGTGSVTEIIARA
ncbi:MAG: 3'-5' exonuclease, partial [Cyclobacteriaceae bacterium]